MGAMPAFGIGAFNAIQSKIICMLRTELGEKEQNALFYSEGLSMK